ncbi:hypothetical protein SALBM311S_10908 [Streptomyces alboniger]
MAIYLTKESKVLVQGMTGGEGMKHTRRMLAAGTNVVGGVNPRKAGRTVDFDVPQCLNGLRGAPSAVPVFGSVADGMRATGADVTVVFVPPAFAKAAVVEGRPTRESGSPSSSPRASRSTTPSPSRRTPSGRAPGSSAPTARA